VASEFVARWSGISSVKRLAADHHARRVGRGVAGDALQLLREVDDPADGRLRRVHLAELRTQRERLLQLDAQLVRDGLGDPVHVPVPVPEHAPDVPDRRAGQHRAERDDLGDVIRAVLLGDVVDHFLASPILEVDVDVRHRHAVRVEEALEREPVVDGVHRRDPQGVRHDGARRAPPAGGLDPLVAGEPHEVGDDQEVAGIPHRDDCPELVVQAGLQLRRDPPVAPGQPRLAFLAEPALGRLSLRHREVRDPQVAQGQLEVHHLGDPAGRPDGVELLREEGRHLRRRLEVEGVRLEAEPPGSVDIAAGADAQEDVVRLGLGAVHVVEVVRDHERQPDLRREAEQLLVEPPLERDAMVLELQEEVALAQDLAVLARQPSRGLPVVDLERLRDLAAETGGHPDQPLAVLRARCSWSMRGL
jgi:hypothetical protein